MAVGEWGLVECWGVERFVVKTKEKKKAA